MKTFRFQGALLAATVSLVLAACGGGGSDSAPPPAAQGSAAPPASAGAGSQGFMAFIASMTNQVFDMMEPFDTSNFAPPSDNTEAQEPVATSLDS